MSQITEKRIYKIDPIAVISNGTTAGAIQVPDNSLFIVRQVVILKSNTQAPQTFKVNRVNSNDKVTIYLGPDNGHISKRSDLSAFLTADNTTIEANEQPRTTVPEQEIERHTYQAEPAVARRTILVDKYGCRIDDDNPLPISGTLTVGDSSGNPNIFNIDAAVADTEYSQALPAGTTQFLIRARNNAKLQISYLAGQTNTVFLTVTPGSIYVVDSVKLTGKTIYFQSTKDNTDVEIVAWN